MIDDLFTDPERARTEKFVNVPGVQFLEGERSGEIRDAMTGVKVEADTHQANAYFSLADPGLLRDAVKMMPGKDNRKRTAEFLERCITLGLLAPADADGNAVRPDVLPVDETMCRAPRFEEGRPSAFAFVGVPWDASTTGMPGTRYGPPSIRAVSHQATYHLDPGFGEPMGFYDAGLGKIILRGVPFADAGNVRVAPGDSREVVYARVTRAVRMIRQAGRIPLVLGGDHSIAYATIAAYAPKTINILHIDAHTDLGDAPLLSEAAYQKNPYAGIHHGNVFTAVLERQGHIGKLVQVGLRGIVDATAFSRAEDLIAFGMERFRAEGADAVVAALPENEPVYISFDIDALDPGVAPTTGTPVPGGLDPYAVKNLLRQVARTRRVVGMEIVEVGPATDPADGTAFWAFENFLTVADGIVERIRSTM